MSDIEKFDFEMMARALKLASRGRSWVAPNPMVGAVVVKNGVIVGEGYHKIYGGPHAEVNALKQAGDKAKGATIYVNLEPCCHFGKTPPCTELIKTKGIKRVVASIKDPNPVVGGKGFDILRDAGVQVDVGVMEEEAKELNCCYLKKASTGQCWVTLKMAHSVDGRIACKTGHSQWITCEKSRKYVHQQRAYHDAVLVGAGTVIADDPSLTVRHVRGRNPIRIVLDTDFSIPAFSKILNTPEDAPTWVIGSKDTLPDYAGNENVKVFQVPKISNEFMDLQKALEIISEEGVGSLFVEGGSKIWTSFLEKGLVDKIEAFVAPIIIGDGINSINDLDVLKVSDAIHMGSVQWKRIGDDMLLSGRVLNGNGRCSCLRD